MINSKTRINPMQPILVLCTKYAVSLGSSNRFVLLRSSLLFVFFFFEINIDNLRNTVDTRKNSVTAVNISSYIDD